VGITLMIEERPVLHLPVLLIGAEALPGKISVKGLRREAGTRRRRALMVIFHGERLPGDRRTARLSVHRPPGRALPEIIAERAAALIDQAAPAGSMDLVAGFARLCRSP
jgi:hypothetical protein